MRWKRRHSRFFTFHLLSILKVEFKLQLSIPGEIWFSWETESKQIHQSSLSVSTTFSAFRLIQVTKTFLVATERNWIDFFKLHYSWQPNSCIWVAKFFRLKHAWRKLFSYQKIRNFIKEFVTCSCASHRSSNSSCNKLISIRHLHKMMNSFIFSLFRQIF